VTRIEAGRRVLEREPVAGPADAGLHLVEPEQGAMLVGDPTGRTEVAGRRHDHAGLALDRLEQHRCRLVVDRSRERVHVAVRHPGDVPGQRLERFAVRRLGGQRQGPHGPSVEGAVSSDHLAPAGPPGQLEGRLVRLGAGVGEEDPAFDVGSGRDEVDQALGQLDLRRCREEVRHVAERRRLRRDGLDDGRMRVAERVDRDPGQQVEVAPPVDVPDVAALAAFEDPLGRAERVHQRTGVPVGPGHDATSTELRRAWRIRIGASGSTWVPMPSSVKISSSTACGSRPSTTVARGTPSLTA
jgi:hypothetical protein